ncbi:MAG: anthranilate phosphoribosyltransferase [Bifidobacteriaceae bacterium]|jgi:anthranilate phosphoribosyltransferase|nr:anthranilate phosphoribosyltransferase [Bifidobacteriaceae bacterium]
MDTLNWTSVTSELLNRRALSTEESEWVMDQIMAGEFDPVLVGSILSLLAAKGESSQEVLGFANSMVAHAEPLNAEGRILDIVGTGGDHAGSVNISSMSAIVLAAAGIKIVKHGNRAATSKSGAADVLAVLGINLELNPSQVKEVYDKVGITFAFAQTFHPSMRFAMPVRKSLPFPTVFNILGPLTNPANPSAVAIGAATERQCRLIAEVYAARNVDGLVFQGQDENGNGLDELAAIRHGQLYEIRNGKASQTTFNPLELEFVVGLEPIVISDIAGGDPEENAEVARAVFAGVGSKDTDTKRDRAIFQTVCLNSAAGIVADGTLLDIAPNENNLVERFAAAYEIAKSTIIEGRAEQKLNDWAEATNSL